MSFSKLNHLVIRKMIMIVLFSMYIYISFSYCYLQYKILESMESQHSLTFDDISFLKSLNRGANYIFDDAAFTMELEPFHKIHLPALSIHNKQGILYLPNLDTDILRGGYYRIKLGNTLRSASKIDYLIQGKGYIHKASVFKYPNESLLHDSDSYRLIDIRGIGAAISGKGWYRCELSHCWTKNNFDIEIFANQNVEIIINIDYFSPPKDGKIFISTDLNNTMQIDKDVNIFKLDIPKGYHILSFSSSWEDQSPRDIGLSGDERKLFAMIRSVVVLRGKN